MNIIQNIEENLGSSIKKNKVFTYDGKQIKCVAFMNGFKHEKLFEFKELIKKTGFSYSFEYECYVLQNCNGNCDGCGKDCIGKYRLERNELIQNLISWKFSNHQAIEIVEGK